MATVHEKTWHSRANIELLNTASNRAGADQVYQLKRALTGEHGATLGLWTVVQSCDGSSISDSDLWTDVSKVLYAPLSSSPQSWIVLRSPGPRHYWIVLGLEYNTNNTVAASWRSQVYADEPTDGSLTSGPTGAVLVGGPTKNYRGFGYDASNPVRFHYALAEDGSFVALWNQRGAKYFGSALVFSHLVESRPADTAPAVVIYGPVSSSPSQAPGPIFNNLNAATFGISRGVGSAAIDDPITTSLLGLCDIWGFSQSGTSLGFIPDAIGTDAGDADGSAPDWHVYVGTREASGAVSRSVRGRIPDIRWAPNLPHGTVEPDLVAPKSIGVGYFWLPIGAIPNLE